MLTNILWIVAVVLIVGWVFGLVSGNTLGGFIWLLLVVAVVVIVINFISGRSAR